MVESNRMNELLRRFAVTMIDTFEVNELLYQLGASAVAILGADGAGISVATRDDRLEFVTATDQSLLELEMVQRDHQMGPCVEAFRRGEPVVVEDIAALECWERYREAAARTGFGAVVGMPLAVGTRRVGSLNIYDRGPRTWSQDDLEAVRTMADIATAYIVRAGELNEARHLAEQLQHALDSRVIVEQAKGVLSRDHAISVDAAFELLRSHSRIHQRQLRDVAYAVVHDGLRLR